MAWWITFHRYVQGSPQALVITHSPHVSTSLSKGSGGLECHIGLPALQPCALFL